MKPVLLLLHVAGIVIWIGGMFFAHFCLRPVAVLQLPPPQRLPLLAAVLGRFFAAVAVSVVAILASGFAMMAAVGFAAAPLHWHLMMGLGVVMAIIFGIIYAQLYPRLVAGVAAQTWPAAGAVMERIRRLVVTNLALGTATVIIAVLGSYLGK